MTTQTPEPAARDRRLAAGAGRRPAAVLGAPGRDYYLTQLIMAAYYAVVVLGLCLVMGYAGQISLGHGAFFAIGGYTSALLTTRPLAAAGERRLGARPSAALGLVAAREDLYGEHAGHLHALGRFRRGHAAGRPGRPAHRLPRPCGSRGTTWPWPPWASA